MTGMERDDEANNRSGVGMSNRMEKGYFWYFSISCNQF